MINFGQKLKSSDDREYYITSDLHFGHKAILRFCPSTRPWSTTEEMDEALISNWSSVVGVDDVVFHLGDFSFKAREYTENIISQLNGHIVFLIGNHDKAIRSQILDLNKFDYLEVRFDGTKVCMMHYPISCWNSAGHGSTMLFGHCHGQFQNVGRSIDVGWDAHGKILTLKEAVDICLDKPIETPDHH